MTEERDQESTEQQQQDNAEQITESRHDDRQTFDAEYVKTLRKEAAEYRTKLRKLEEAEQKRAQAEMSENERLKAEKEQAETKANETLTKANQRAVRSEARVRALEAGVKPERVAAVLRLSDLSGVEVAEDGEPDAKAVGKAIEATLKEYPEFKASHAVGGSGSNPAGSDGNTAEKNPWSREHFNLTEQGRIAQSDPAKAHQLMKAAQG